MRAASNFPTAYVVISFADLCFTTYFFLLYQLHCQGCKTLQFFYQNPVDDIKIGFPPVRVNTEEEVNCVVALVTEKAEEFNR